MKMLYVLLGDVVSSARAADRTLLERRLSAACRAASRAAGRDMYAPLKTLKGVDEVGGALISARPAYGVLCAFHDAMHPFRTRFVLVRGGVDIGLSTRDATRLDGPAFTDAAALMLKLKKSGLPFAAALDSRGLDAGIAGLFNVLLTMRWNWTEKQRAGMTAYRETGSQQAAAGRMGVSQQAVSKALRSASWRVYLQAEEALRTALANLDDADPSRRSSKGAQR